MIDITKDEIWDVKNEEIVTENRKNNSIKGFAIKHKLLSAGIIVFTVCVIANIALIYSFLKMIKLL